MTRIHFTKCCAENKLNIDNVCRKIEITKDYHLDYQLFIRLSTIINTAVITILSKSKSMNCQTAKVVTPKSFPHISNAMGMDRLITIAPKMPTF